MLRDLLEASYLDQTCRVTYRTPRAQSARTFVYEPYEVFPFDGGLYALGYVPRRSHVRMLAVERIQSIERTDRDFQRREEIERLIAEKKHRAFRILDDGHALNVHLRFSAEQAPYIAERTWHPEETVQWNVDGSLDYWVAASGRFEIVRWILGWGPAVEVLAPAGLRKEVREKLEAAREQYA